MFCIKWIQNNKSIIKLNICQILKSDFRNNISPDNFPKGLTFSGYFQNASMQKIFSVHVPIKHFYQSLILVTSLAWSSYSNVDNLLILKTNFHSATPMGAHCLWWLISIMRISHTEHHTVRAWHEGRKIWKYNISRPYRLIWWLSLDCGNSSALLMKLLQFFHQVTSSKTVFSKLWTLIIKLHKFVLIHCCF